MTRRQFHTPVLCATAILLAGCDALNTGVSGNPVGVGGLTARTSGTGFTTSPLVTFYRVTSGTFVTTAGVRDTCLDITYSEAATSPSTSATGIGGGTQIIVQLGSRTDTLRRTTGSTDLTYRSSLAAGLAYTPGDSMTFTVAGDANGFPAATFSGKTAEAFTLDPVNVPAAGAPITLTWTPATDANAAMAMSLRYVTGTGTTFNRQISCTFVDDGTATVPGAMASPWISATTRAIVAQRNRTILEQVTVPLSYFNIVSTFTVPTPVSP